MKPILVLLVSFSVTMALALPAAQGQFQYEDLIFRSGSWTRFGSAVAISHDVCVVGAPEENHMGHQAVGGAYVHRFNPDTQTWEQEANLTGSGGYDYRMFGAEVSVSGDVIVIGEPGAGTSEGLAKIYRYNGAAGTWDYEKILNPYPYGAPYDRFGSALGLDGDVAFAGAPGDDNFGTDAGSVYVFGYNSGTGQWGLNDILVPSGVAPGDEFGNAVALQGDLALIGAWMDDDNGVDAGSAYVLRYNTSTGTWEEEAKLRASDGSAEDKFGFGVAIFGDVALVGAPYDDDLGNVSGSAYIFRYDAGSATWTQEAKLLGQGGGSADRFGISVSLFGEVALVGAYEAIGAGVDSGAAYLYRFDHATGTWPLDVVAVPSDGARADHFGSSVSLSGNTGLIGAPQGDSAYLYYFDATRFVDVANTSGPWYGSQEYPFPSIQDGIDATRDGDTVLVSPGTYRERIKIANKGVAVRSAAGPEATVIDASQAGSVVTFVGEGLRLSMLEGFTITNGQADFGGGISCIEPASPIIRNNIIAHNRANFDGGGIYCYPVTRVAAEIADNLVLSNSAGSGGYGGGICCVGQSPPLVNNVVALNSAYKGAGIRLYSSPNVLLVNNTIVQNTALSSGGGVSLQGYGVAGSMTNTIVWGNDASFNPEIDEGSAVFDISFCDIKGGWPGTANIDADPLLVDTVHLDFHLTWDSPCRNTGSNTAGDLPDADFEGDPRVVQGTADMGADEFSAHFYHRGAVVAGGTISLCVTGEVGKQALAVLGSGVADPPVPTVYGDLHLVPPVLRAINLGVIPATGVQIVDLKVPLFVVPGSEYPLQTLIGPQGNPNSELTNLLLLRGE